MAEIKLVKMVEGYRRTNDPKVQQELYNQIMLEMKDMPTEERQGVLKQVKEGSIAVLGQEPTIDNIYLKMMDMHCALIVETWQGIMTEEVWKMVNGNRGTSLGDINDKIEESLASMLETDPIQYEIFVKAVNNRVVDPMNNGVPKAQKVLNIENEALRQLKDIVNTFEMKRTLSAENDGREGM